MSRKRYVGNDPRLIKLCTECKRGDCNGEKCSKYLEIEMEILDETTAKTPSKDSFTLNTGMVGPEPSPRRKSGKTGLRLYNELIDMLEDLRDESDTRKQRQIEQMINALRKWRMESFESNVDWYAMEE